ncbi:MAG: class I SAM-dependent methyltransferase [Nitriliruptoraceae bacterium]
MRVLSAQHALYWAHPRRVPEAFRRVVRARRGNAWCRSVAQPSPASDRLFIDHANALDDARNRVGQSTVRLGGAANLGLLYDVAERVEARRVIETGVAYGWSTLAILLSIAPRSGHLWSIDLPYPYGGDRQPVGVAVPDELREQWTLIVGSDRDHVSGAIAEATSGAGTLDLAHYDSDKTPSGMIATCTALFDALRPGGVLVVDDVGDHLGFKQLCQRLQVPPLVYDHHGKYQGVIHKTAR